MAVAYLGIGTNVGDRSANIARALRMLSRVAAITRISPVYETAPLGFTDQPPFWNLAVRVSTSLPPLELMLRLKALERDMGRTPTFRDGPRLIDIDILFYDDAVLDTPSLQVPHPRALQRAFVLRPLTDIAPGLADPRTGLLVAGSLDAVADQSAKPLPDQPSAIRDWRVWT